MYNFVFAGLISMGTIAASECISVAAEGTQSFYSEKMVPAGQNTQIVEVKIQSETNNAQENQRRLEFGVNFYKKKEKRVRFVFSNGDLRGINFATVLNAELPIVFSFIKCNLSDVSFKNCFLKGVLFDECNLTKVNFSGTDLSNADDEWKLLSSFRNKHSDEKKLISVYSNTSFKGSDIEGANFTGAKVDKDNISKARNVEKAIGLADIQIPVRVGGYLKSIRKK